MIEIIEQMLERCANGTSTMLVTVVADAGSAPRGAGASMIVGSSGRLLGTIGGGMLEYRAVQKAQKDLEEGMGGLTGYRLTPGESADLGMVCGGAVDVLFTYVAATEANKGVLSEVRKHLLKHVTGWLLLPFSGTELGFFGEDDSMSGVDMTLEVGGKELADFSLGVIETSQGKCYVQKLMNNSRVYIFGGGHLAQELVPLLSHLGFRCIVTDDRAEYSARALFPDAEEVHTLDYTNLEGSIDVQPQDYIVVITRGHVGDYEVLRFALKTHAFYIGAVGSRTKIATVNGKLKAEGFTESDISRLTSPIGISIRSETPAEIAVSIAAQLIEKRAMLGESGR